MVLMDSFYIIFLYPITFILSPFLANHTISCLGFCVDMVSNLDLVSMIFTLHISKMLRWHAINVYINHNGFCIASALRALPMQDSITESKTINYILFMVFC